MKLAHHHALVGGVMIAALAASSIGWAQRYPTRPVRVIVPFAPGGATDIIARPILQELSKRLGQQFYVENVPGASGNIGTAQAAKAAPDGYTILLAYSSHASNQIYVRQAAVRSDQGFCANHDCSHLSGCPLGASFAAVQNC